jgi:hypothetical protein
MKTTMNSIILSTIAIVAIGLTATTMHPTQVQASGPSACPDPGQCTCNAASGVMTDHAMQAPFNRINNGCTESGPF